MHHLHTIYGHEIVVRFCDSPVNLLAKIAASSFLRKQIRQIGSKSDVIRMSVRLIANDIGDEFKLDVRTLFRETSWS